MSVEDARQANELLAFALRPGTRPASRDRYSALMQRLATDPGFAHVFEVLLEPLGLQVLAADPLHGMILQSLEGSPFAPTLEALRVSLVKQPSAEERMLYGLILAGIAAWCYPDAEAFAARGVRQVRASQVERKLRELCERMLAQGEPANGPAELAQVWSVYAARKAHKVGQNGKLSRACTLGMVRSALGWLADQYFLLRDPSDPDLFRATDRFRYHVQTVASRDAYRLIASAVRDACGGS